MKAVIMAGGEGTRLRPLTSYRPKPMVPLVNTPILEHVIRLLKSHNIRDIVLTLHYLPQTIMEYFSDGSRFGVKLNYKIEEKPLGTAGGVRNCYDLLDERFIVISGDVFTNVNISEIVKFHVKRGALITIAFTRSDNPTEYGIALLDDEGRVTRYLEKPSWGEVFSDLINMGIYVIEPELLEYIPRNTTFDFSRDLFPLLIRRNEAVYGWVTEDVYWSDIGTHTEYLKTHRDILSGVVKAYIPSRRKDDIWIGNNVKVEEGVEIEPSVVIGDNVRIKSGAKIGKYTVIGNGTIIDSGVHIERSVIWGNTYVGSNTRIMGAIIASKNDISSDVYIGEGAVIGDECKIGRGVIIKSGIKIWPAKIIDPYTTVSINLKWGIRWAKRVFGPWGISGLANIEITPELAVRIGMAIGTWIGKGKSVVVSRDPYKTSRMLKRALVSGLLSTGVYVYNLKVATTPMLRYYIRHAGASAGVAVITPVANPYSIKIKVFDESGLDISTRDREKIERILAKEEFNKVLADEVLGMCYPSGVVESYLNNLLSKISTKKVKRRRPKIIIDCGNGAASLVAPVFFSKIGAEAIPVNARSEENLPPRDISQIPDMVKTLAGIVKAVEADLGVMFDEDGDRIIVVDDSGNVISGDTLLALLAKEELTLSGGGNVVIPVTASRVMDKIIKEYDGRAIRVKSDARAILEGIIKHDAIFGGDERGAFAYPRYIVGFDGVIATYRLLEAISEGRKLSDMVKKLPLTYMAKSSFKVSTELRGKIIRRMLEELKENNIDVLDGIKVVEEHGWVLIRPRPHEPFFDLYAESDNLEYAETLLRRYTTFVHNILSRIGGTE